MREDIVKEGIEGRQQVEVTKEDTAVAKKSGELRVYATPAMTALMEQTAWMSVAPYLEEGMSSVGTMLQIRHVAPTPVGMKVTCTSKLVKVEGRKLVFELQVEDEKGLIGEGIHERFIVSGDKFQRKADEKGKE